MRKESSVNKEKGESGENGKNKGSTCQQGTEENPKRKTPISHFSHLKTLYTSVQL
jgi:hypothetical protein